MNQKYSPQEVIDLLASYVVGKYPVPSGVIAQLILEVGFSLKTPKDIDTGRESYNLGNIKGVGPAGSVTIWTTEYYNGVRTKVKDQFRAYHNYGEAIDDHFKLLNKPRYVKAGVWEAKTPREYAEALKRGGYATDPKYVEKIMAIVDRYNLTRFDKVEVKIITKKEEGGDNLVLKEDWQWDMLVNTLEKLHKDGVLNSSDWIEKTKTKEITVSELTWINTILIGRSYDK